MLTIALPLILCLCAQFIAFSEKDKKASGDGYTLGRLAYSLWIFGLWILCIIGAGIGAAVDGTKPGVALAFVIWTIWMTSIIPSVGRRLQNIGWPKWWGWLLLGQALTAFVPKLGDFTFGACMLFCFALCFIRGEKALEATKKPNQKPIGVRSTVPVAVSHQRSKSFVDAVVGLIACPEIPSNEITQKSPVKPDAPDNRPISQPPPLPSARVTTIGQISLSQNGVVYGPHFLSEVIGMWDRGQIAGNALYWHDQLSDWKPLSDDIGALRQMLV